MQVSKEIHGKMFNTLGNLVNNDPSNQSSLGKTSPVLRLSTHIYGVSKEIDGKILNFQVNFRHETPEIDCLSKIRDPVLTVSTHISGNSNDRQMGKCPFIRVNLGM